MRYLNGMPEVLRAPDGATGSVEDPVVEAGATGGAEPPVQPAAGATGTAGATGAAQAPDWRDRRIAQQTARLAQERAEKAQLAEEVRRLKATPPASGEAPAVALDEAEVERRIDAEVGNRAALLEFNRSCDAVAAEGRAAFADFDARIQAMAGGLVDRTDRQSVAAYNTLLQVAMEVGDAHRLLHELGGNLDEAARIMSLSPARMGVQLAKLQAKLEADGEGEADGDNALAGRKPRISGAPKPITPVGNRGPNKELIAPSDPTRAHQLSSQEWHRRRDEEVAARATKRATRH